MQTFTVGDSTRLNGSVNADASGATVTLHFRKPDGSTVNKAATWVSAIAGTWTYDVAPGDFNVAGVWWVEAEVVFANSEVQTFGPNRFRVLDQIA